MSTDFATVLDQLEQERSLLKSQLEQVGNALSALNAGAKTSTGRTMSAQGRARIAAAQRARWAKVKRKKASATIPAQEAQIVCCCVGAYSYCTKSTVGKVEETEQSGLVFRNIRTVTPDHHFEVVWDHHTERAN